MPNEIKLAVVIDKQTLIDSMLDALQQSPEALERVAGLVDPISFAFAASKEEAEELNKQLAEMAAKMKVVQDQVQKVQGTSSNQFKQLKTDVTEFSQILRSETELSEVAAENLLELRTEILVKLEQENLSRSDAATLSKELLRVNQAIARQVDETVIGRSQEREQLQQLIILSRTNSDIGKKAQSELIAQQTILKKRLDDENLSREESVFIARQLLTVEDAIAEVRRGSARDALRRGREAGGPDPFGTILDLGRVAEDAKFGLIGIANNLGPLLENFIRLNTQAGNLKTSLAAIVKGTIFSPIGWILLLNLLTTIIFRKDEILNFLQEALGIINAQTKAARELSKELDSIASRKLGVSKIDDREILNAIDRVGLAIDDFEKKRDDLEKILREKIQSSTGGFFGTGVIESGLALFGLPSIAGLLSDEVSALEDEIDKLDDLIKKGLNNLTELQKSRSRAISDAIAISTSILSGAGVNAVTEELDKQAEAQDKSLLKQREQLLEHGEEKLELQKILARKEQDEREEDIEREIDTLRATYQELLLVFKKSQDDLDDEQRKAFRENLRFIEENIAIFNDALERQQSLTEDIIAKIVRDFEEEEKKKIEKEKREAERRRREAEQANKRRIAALKVLQNQELDLIKELFEQVLRSSEDKEDTRVELATLATDKIILDLERELDSYEGSQRQKEELTVIINNRIIAAEQKLAEDIVEIRRDEARKEIDRRQQLASMRLDIISKESDKSKDVEARIAQEQIRSRAEVARIQSEIDKLILQEETEFTNQRIELLNELIDAEEKASQRRQTEIRVTQLERDQAALRKFQRDFETTQIEIEEINASFLKNQLERDLKLIESRLKRDELEAKLDRKDQIAAAEQIEDEEIRTQALITIEERFQAELKNIREEARKEEEKAEREAFERRLDRALSEASSISSTLANIASLSLENFITQRQRELRELGLTEEEANKIIEKEGRKRIKTKKTLAKIQIAIATAVSAKEAFKSAFELGLPFPFNYALGLTAAGLAIAFGREQIRAVDQERISGGGGGGGSAGAVIGVGEKVPPGLQGTPESVLFTSTGAPTSINNIISSGRSNNEAIVNRLDEMNRNLIMNQERTDQLANAMASRPVFADVTDHGAVRIVNRAGEVTQDSVRP